MNIVNLRSVLRPMCEKLWPRRKVAEAPLFVVSNYDEALSRMGSYDRDGLRDLIYNEDHLANIRAREMGMPLAPNAAGDTPIMRLPFPEFIIYTPASVSASGKHRRPEVFVVVESPTALNPDILNYFPEDEDGVAIGSTAIRPEGNRYTSYTTTFFNPKNGEVIADDDSYERLMWTQYSHLRKITPQDKPLPAFESPEWVPMLRVISGMRIKPFLFEVFYPSNHIVTTRPAGVGKSVEWVKSRTHFTVMDRRSMSHVSKTGVPLSAKEHQEQVRRSAHRRIAHFRVLRAPRFGVNIGKRINVRSAWVGPKEWIGTDGKIYHVVDKGIVQRKSISLE